MMATVRGVALEISVLKSARWNFVNFPVPDRNWLAAPWRRRQKSVPTTHSDTNVVRSVLILEECDDFSLVAALLQALTCAAPSTRPTSCCVEMDMCSRLDDDVFAPWTCSRSADTWRMTRRPSLVEEKTLKNIV